MSPLDLQDITLPLSKELVYALDHISEGIMIETADRKITFINEPFLKIFNLNFPKETLYGVDCVEASRGASVLFADPESFVRRIIEIFRRRQPIYNEELKLKEGKYLWRNYLPIVADNILIGHLWVYIDSTDFNQLREEKRSQELYYHDILSNVPADIGIFNAKQQYLFLNSKGTHNTELNDWLIGKTDYDYCNLRNIDPAFAHLRFKHFRKALETGETVNFVETKTKPDGTKEHVLRKFYPKKRSENEVDYVIGYGIDITEQIEKTEQLSRSERRYKKLLDMLQDVVITVDEHYHIVFANPAWEKVFGYCLEDTLQQHISDFLAPEEYLGLQEVLAKARTNSLPENFKKTLSIVTNAGLTRHLELYFSDVDDVLEDSGRISFFMKDITDQVHQLEAYKELAEKEKHLNDMKSGFVNMTSHELRTPLAVIQSCTEIIQLLSEENQLTPEELKYHTDTVIGQVDKMTSLMNELLLISKIESGKEEFNPVADNIVEFVKAISSQYFQPWNDGRSLELQLPDSNRMVNYDKFMMHHIVMNLLENAFKYSPAAPPPVLELCFEEHQWKMVVKDFGVGIPPDDLQQIYAPFFRGTNVKDIQGTGMGLVLVNRFVKQHAGDMQIHSEVNKGTAFSIHFPYVRYEKNTGDR